MAVLRSKSVCITGLSVYIPNTGMITCLSSIFRRVFLMAWCETVCGWLVQRDKEPEAISLGNSLTIVSTSWRVLQQSLLASKSIGERNEDSYRLLHRVIFRNIKWIDLMDKWCKTRNSCACLILMFLRAFSLLQKLNTQIYCCLIVYTLVAKNIFLKNFLTD